MKSRSNLRRQETRLRRVLERALLVALAAPATFVGAQACSSDKTPAGDGGVDASIGDGAISDAGPDVIEDAGPCAPFVVQVDAQAPDGGVECGVFQRFPCGIPAGQTIYSDCYFLLDDCPNVCPGSLFFNCHVYGDSCVDGSIVGDADLIVECASCPNGVGRRPVGLHAASSNDALTRAGAWFAKAAHLEAASVHAFRILGRELMAHRAPRSLVKAAERAEADEIRHTKMTAKLARARGGKPERARVTKRAVRSIEAIALENAIEGCVRETFGALFAMWQAEHAEDHDVSRAMKKIAADEARHAALSWSVAAWAEARLDEAARSRIDEAKAKALRDLETEIDRDPHAELMKVAGVPSARSQRAMLRALTAELAA